MCRELQTVLYQYYLFHLQLSAVSDLLSQLISAGREALVQDTNSLRDTITALQTQLQQQVLHSSPTTPTSIQYMYSTYIICRCTDSHSQFTLSLSVSLQSEGVSAQAQKVFQENEQLRITCQLHTQLSLQCMYTVVYCLSCSEGDRAIGESFEGSQFTTEVYVHILYRYMFCFCTPVRTLHVYILHCIARKFRS